MSNNANSTHPRPLSYSDVMGFLLRWTVALPCPSVAFHHYLALTSLLTAPSDHPPKPLSLPGSRGISLPPASPCGLTLRAPLSLDALLLAGLWEILALDLQMAQVYIEREWAQRAEKPTYFPFFSLWDLVVYSLTLCVAHRSWSGYCSAPGRVLFSIPAAQEKITFQNPSLVSTECLLLVHCPKLTVEPLKVTVCRASYCWDRHSLIIPRGHTFGSFSISLIVSNASINSFHLNLCSSMHCLSEKLLGMEFWVKKGTCCEM